MGLCEGCKCYLIDSIVFYKAATVRSQRGLRGLPLRQQVLLVGKSPAIFALPPAPRAPSADMDQPLFEVETIASNILWGSLFLPDLYVQL
jgi:hypothetical protein